jgi:hypothetical protein
VTLRALGSREVCNPGVGKVFLIEWSFFRAAMFSLKLGPGKVYIIMARRSWEKIQRQNPDLSPPLVESAGAGPEGDAPLVLVQVDGS